jgi:hypothetical protein
MPRVGFELTIPAFWQGKTVQVLDRTAGCAVAQAVSRWLPTAAACVRGRSGHMGFVVDKAGSGAGFLRVLRFPLPIIIPPISPSS